MRWWAFWRRVQYLTGLFIFFLLIGTGIYFVYLYEEPSCFDKTQNGDERGTDCGGSCTRVCSLDIIKPSVLWSRAFKVTDGQYNAVAYIENNNLNVGTPSISYTFSLYDQNGLIVERKGTTVLPPDSVYPIFEGHIETGNRVPTQTFIELGETELWLPASAGREQFRVERRELKSADSKPRLDASVRNLSVEDATDVEIVATIFDANGNALTSSQTVVQYFEGDSTKNIVFTWPEPIAKTVKSCEVPTDVVLAIDLSGSMNDDGGDPPEPVTSVLEAAGSFVKRLRDNDKISVVTYATEAQVRQELTDDKETAADLVSGLMIAPADEVGSTNTGDAIKLAEEELSSSRHNDDARKMFVLLTDGLANAPGEEPEQYALDAASSLRGSGVDVFTIGLGDNLNEEFLRGVASSNEHYFRAASVRTIDRIYRSITTAICEEGAAVIEIIPKTSTSFAPLR